eukprot:scaffold50038_cov81-Phaeocystis_antarctica.AAC.2
MRALTALGGVRAVQQLSVLAAAISTAACSHRDARHGPGGPLASQPPPTASTRGPSRTPCPRRLWVSQRDR